MTTRGITADNPQSIAIRGSRVFYSELIKAVAELLAEDAKSRMVELELSPPKGRDDVDHARSTAITLILIDGNGVPGVRVDQL